MVVWRGVPRTSPPAQITCSVSGCFVRAADSKHLLHEFSLADLTPKAAVLGQLLKFSVKKLFGKVEQTRRPVEPGVAA